jgi:hypothetical protein
MSRFMHRFPGVVLAVGVLAAVAPTPAHADTLYLDILSIRCVEQSESFSDEIRLRVNGQIRGMWNDVDTSEIHWYWSSGSSQSPLDIPFSSDSVFIDILEEDSDLNLIGSLEVPASMVNTGEHEVAASMSDGFYAIRFSVSTTP